MKFYSKNKNQVVFDGERNRRLCKFKDGEYETENPRIIKMLTTRHNFKTDGIVPIEEPEELILPIEEPEESGSLADMTKAQLLEIAGDNVNRRMTKAEIIKAIEG